MVALSGPGRGHFETMERIGDAWNLSGWICHPDQPTSTIEVRVDGDLVSTLAPEPRQDVASVFDWIPHAAASGFRVSIPGANRARIVSVEAFGESGSLTSLKTTLHDAFATLPHPPPELMQRVSGSPDPRFFDADGVRSYSEFVEVVARYRDWSSISRMLDWGCGCGRVTRGFLRARPEIEVHGADIDSEAISWCNDNLTGGHFRAIAPDPPTSFPDDFFPLVLGYSVFSHLNREQQHSWLAEIRRVMSPGGLFLASVHGPFAARFCLPREGTRVGRWWRRKAIPYDIRALGYLDWGEDSALDGVAPAGYYRGIFQSPEWTRREWSRHFRVLAILEGGMQNYQDLVVLERT